MKITLVPPAFSMVGGEPLPYLTSLLINDAVAIDAGSLGFVGPPQEQARIKHVLLSHTHIDHIASLPIFLENIFESVSEPATIHGTETVLKALQTDLFNDRLWPDFIRLSLQGKPILKLQTLQPGKAIELEGLRITPVPVNHVVPTCGFIIEDKKSAVIIAGDTGPTEEIWQRGNALPHLKAIFLEATFPNAMAELADLAKHLTPATFAAEVRKVTRPVPVIAVHIKARFFGQIVTELKALGLPRLEIGQYDSPYDF